MTDEDPGGHRWVPGGITVRRGLPWAIGLSVFIAGLALAWKYGWTNPVHGGKPADASVVISTFITLYGLFLTGFGVLVGFVVAKKQARGALKFVAIIFLIEATIVDLWRVSDSTNDLYNAATSGLSHRALYDITHDFFAYFVINVFVVMVAVLAACLPPRSREPGRPQTLARRRQRGIQDQASAAGP